MRRKTLSLEKPIITVQENNSEDSSDQACQVYSIASVARMLNCSETTVYAAVRESRFPCLRLGKTLRIPKLALQRVLESGDLNPTVVETRVLITEQMAQMIARAIAKELLALGQQMLGDQLRSVGGDVRL